jgi:hypothetical protein
MDQTGAENAISFLRTMLQVNVSAADSSQDLDTQHES